jgi:CTP:molybdopterin cytidylyltransferase MocA
MGRDKLSAPLAGRSPLERLADLLHDRTVWLVTSRSSSALYAGQFPSATIVVNDTPERGMTSSFRAALTLVGDCDPVGVVLGDKPLLSRVTLERLENAAVETPCDVVYPQSRDGEPGHPVYLSRRALGVVENLPDGDTLRMLRETPELGTLAVPCDDAGAYIDIDTEEDWSRAERLELG